MKCQYCNEKMYLNGHGHSCAAQISEQAKRIAELEGGERLMDNPYMTQEELNELQQLLTYKNAIRDSIDAWKRMRILGVSASLAVSGNVSRELVFAFDKIKKIIEEAN